MNVFVNSPGEGADQYFSTLDVGGGWQWKIVNKASHEKSTRSNLVAKCFVLESHFQLLKFVEMQYRFQYYILKCLEQSAPSAINLPCIILL